MKHQVMPQAPVKMLEKNFPTFHRQTGAGPAAPQKFSKKPGGGVGVVWILTFGYIHLHVSICPTCEHIGTRCKVLHTCNERIDIEYHYHLSRRDGGKVCAHAGRLWF